MSKTIADTTNVVTRPNGTRKWYRGNQRHREDGPAIEWADGSKEWYRDGHRHREDGPAVERADGSESWHLDGREVTREEVLGRAPSM
jgi:hypothetical protein